MRKPTKIELADLPARILAGGEDHAVIYVSVIRREGTERYVSITGAAGDDRDMVGPSHKLIVDSDKTPGALLADVNVRGYCLSAGEARGIAAHVTFRQTP